MGGNSASKSTGKASQPGKFTKTYLFLYNFVQVIGWSYILYTLIKYYTTPKKELSLWETVKPAVVIFQNAAVLEILHAALRLVSSNVVMTTFQVFSRVALVCGVLLATPAGAASPGVSLALLAWSFAEIIRYLFYSLNLVGSVPSILVWLRYTAFIILYPIGVTGELLCLYAGQAYVANNSMWTIQMPNPWNFTFSYQYLLVFIMLLYVPLFPQMYMHMFAQRRKVLGGGGAEKKSK